MDTSLPELSIPFEGRLEIVTPMLIRLSVEVHAEHWHRSWLKQKRVPSIFHLTSTELALGILLSIVWIPSMSVR